MVRRGRAWNIGTAALVGLLGACGAIGAPDPPAPSGGLRVEFEDTLAPAAFSRTGIAVPDGPDGAAGLWAAAPGLRQPERARVEHLGTGATVEVALFSGRGGSGSAIRLSADAAAALDIGPQGARVQVTALRREPRLAGR